MKMSFSLLYLKTIYNIIMKKIKFIYPLIIIIIIVSLLTNLKTINTNDYIYPTYEKNISSYFGYRNLFGNINFHNGVDFPVPEGTPVYATQSGIIKICSFIKGFGMSILIQNYDGNQVLYAHLSESFLVNVGEQVIQGQQIATVGPKFLSNGTLNGLTTGPHLHFTIYNKNGTPTNPLDFNLKKK